METIGRWMIGAIEIIAWIIITVIFIFALLSCLALRRELDHDIVEDIIKDKIEIVDGENKIHTKKNKKSNRRSLSPIM